MTHEPANQTESVTLATADGERLQAELSMPEAPRVAVVITHPHPLHGGDMFTPVPAALFRALPAIGAAGVRFNFRGVGDSTGTHDSGQAEQLDVRAAMTTLSERAPNIPLISAGWSFGADVALSVDDARISGWFLAAAVLRVVDPNSMAARTHDAPKRFVVPEVDQYAPPATVAPIVETWTNTSLVVIPGADHFFGGHMQPVVAHFAAFVEFVDSAADTPGTGSRTNPDH